MRVRIMLMRVLGFPVIAVGVVIGLCQNTPRAISLLWKYHRPQWLRSGYKQVAKRKRLTIPRFTITDIIMRIPLWSAACVSLLIIITGFYIALRQSHPPTQHSRTHNDITCSGGTGTECSDTITSRTPPSGATAYYDHYITYPTTGRLLAAAPNGTGSECTRDKPCSVTMAFHKAEGGDTIEYGCGEYYRASDMIRPPADKSGQPGKPITVQPAQPQCAILYGRGATIPVYLDNVSHWRIRHFYVASEGGKSVMVTHTAHFNEFDGMQVFGNILYSQLP